MTGREDRLAGHGLVGHGLVGHGLAVVTGATSGIGAALADALAARGHDLLLVARSAESLDERSGELADLHGVAVTTREVDLTDTMQRAALTDELGRTDVSILCANAGTGGFGPFTTLRNTAQAELNVTATVALIEAVLAGMIGRGRGGVLLSGSVAGNQPMPGASTYAAGKAFVGRLGVALNAELRGTGVTCTVLAPGPVRTGFARRSRVRPARIPGAVWIDADRAAAAGLRGLDQGRRRVTPGTIPRLLGLAGRLAPDALVLPVVRAAITHAVSR